MAKPGRKNKYDTIIKPRFDEITDWLRNGATEKQIYENSKVFIDNGYMTKTENGIALTRKGFLMSNAILSEIL